MTGRQLHDGATRPKRILHLSDLHRSPTLPVRNAALLESLRRDFDRCESPVPVDLVVVSGDVVQGVSADKDPDDVRAEYAEAADFLHRLADYAVQGDHERVVIVPGNHDVSWPLSDASMEPVPLAADPKDAAKARSELKKQMRRPGSGVRWSWRDFSFQRVKSRSLYNDRFRYFAEFYSSFYNGKRTFSLDPEAQCDVFDYPGLHLTVVGFNSCHENDSLQTVAEIDPACIARVSERLRDPRLVGRLLVAVWHHSIHGRPIDDDYMDAKRIENLIELGFQVGLHGHQHKNQLVYEHSRVTPVGRMLLFSAGSLCAGHDEIPPGHRRGFNLITLDASAGMAHLGAREMAMGSPFDCPIWREAQVEGASVPTVEIPSLSVERVQAIKRRRRALLNEADDLLRKDPRRSLALLDDLPDEDPTVRRIRLSAFAELDEWTTILDRYPPTSDGEAVGYLAATWRLRRESMRAALALPLIRESKDNTVVKEREKYTRMLDALEGGAKS